MSKFNLNYIDKEHSVAYKGIFCVMVLLAHISSSLINYFEIWKFNFLTPMGYLAVSGFLFLSGYGMAFSTRNKGPRYYDNYLRQRIFPIYIKYLCFAVLYCVFYLLLFDTKLLMKDIVCTLLIGRTYVANGWYVQCIIVLYLNYYLCYRTGLLKYSKMAPVLIIMPYILICMVFGFDYIYIQSILAFCGGYYFGEIQNRIKCIISQPKGYFGFALFNVLLFVVSCTCFACLKNEMLKALSKMSVCFFFPFVFMAVVSRCNLNRRFIAWLGHNSLEIYLVQGFFLLLFGRVIKIDNMILYIMLVSVSTLVTAHIAHVFWEKIFTK